MSSERFFALRAGDVIQSVTDGRIYSLTEGQYPTTSWKAKLDPVHWEILGPSGVGPHAIAPQPEVPAPVVPPDAVEQEEKRLAEAEEPIQGPGLCIQTSP